MTIPSTPGFEAQAAIADEVNTTLLTDFCAEAARKIASVDEIT